MSRHRPSLKKADERPHFSGDHGDLEFSDYGREPRIPLWWWLCPTLIVDIGIVILTIHWWPR
jgi:hypothetical protein